MANSERLSYIGRVAALTAGTLVAAFLPAAIVACSSSPIPADTIFATPGLTGYIVAGSQQALRTDEDLAVGNANANVPGSTLRGIMSFDLTSLPAGAKIVSAKLYARECAVAGHPIPGLGNVLVEHVFFGSSVDTSTYSIAPIDSTGGVFTADSTVGPRSRYVTASVLADLAAARTVSQFRLQMSEFENTFGSTSNYVAFQAPSGAHNDICSPVVQQGMQLIIRHQ